MIARAVAGTLLLVAAAAGVAALALALGLGDREPLTLRVAQVTRDASAASEPDADPLAWDRSRRAQFEQRAATGSSHVIYEMSPGGAVASAKRTAAYRAQIEAAAERHGVDADTREAVIFLESAGRPNVIAGPTPESAAGLAQILPSTATDLLGMSVDLPQSIAITERISHSRSPAQTDRLEAERASVDQRFDPEAAIDGAAQYLELAGERFGDDELAVVSYHMGIGNLETVLRTYAGADDATPIGDLVAADQLSYARIYFDSGPDSHRAAYELLSGFGDESADYLWKVLASEQVMELYRKDPERLAATAELATNKATMEEVFHPENETPVFDDPGAIEDAIDDGDLLPLPDQPALGWEPDRDIGELAAQLDQSPELYRALRPEALATLTYMAGLVRNISGAATPLQVTSAVRDREYQDLLVGVNPEATREYSLHTTGWAFDIRRDYESRRQAEAFQFVLNRLRALALIDYAVEPGAIHVTVSNLGGELLRG
ncbi:MAG: transglycosylase SLT domain-containing protein [Vicinamibacteria bacterium]